MLESTADYLLMLGIVDSIRLRFDAQTHSSVFADKTEVVDVRNWPAGIYVLRWMTDNRKIAETKLIVQ